MLIALVVLIQLDVCRTHINVANHLAVYIFVQFRIDGGSLTRCGSRCRFCRFGRAVLFWLLCRTLLTVVWPAEARLVAEFALALRTVAAVGTLRTVGTGSRLVAKFRFIPEFALALWTVAALRTVTRRAVIVVARAVALWTLWCIVHILFLPLPVRFRLRLCGLDRLLVLLVLFFCLRILLRCCRRCRRRGCLFLGCRLFLGYRLFLNCRFCFSCWLFRCGRLWLNRLSRCGRLSRKLFRFLRLWFCGFCRSFFGWLFRLLWWFGFFFISVVAT